jgi:hypothetical protein
MRIDLLEDDPRTNWLKQATEITIVTLKLIQHRESRRRSHPKPGQISALLDCPTSSLGADPAVHTVRE